MEIMFNICGVEEKVRKGRSFTRVRGLPFSLYFLFFIFLAKSRDKIKRYNAKMGCTVHTIFTVGVQDILFGVLSVCTGRMVDAHTSKLCTSCEIVNTHSCSFLSEGTRR